MPELTKKENKPDPAAETAGHQGGFFTSSIGSADYLIAIALAIRSGSRNKMRQSISRESGAQNMFSH